MLRPRQAGLYTHHSPNQTIFLWLEHCSTVPYSQTFTPCETELGSLTQFISCPQYRPNCPLTVTALVSLCKSIDRIQILDWRSSSVLFVWELRWLQRPENRLSVSSVHCLWRHQFQRNEASGQSQRITLQCGLYSKISLFVSYRH
jgi:hypothetical protein